MEINYNVFTTRNPNPLKSLWIGKCTIYEFEDIVDPNTYQSKLTKVEKVVNEPCRVSYNREAITNTVNGVPVIAQGITLFIRPDLEIKPGSVIEVTQHNKTTKYKGSSQPTIYTNHQEISLELYEEYA